MNISFKHIILFLFLVYSQITKSAQVDNNYKGTWAGIEVMGVDLKSAQALRDLMPFRNGDTFLMSEAQKYQLICSNQTKNISEADSLCSLILYGDGSVYLSVDIVPKQSKKAIFREIPKKKGQVATLPEKIINLYNQWDQRRSILMSSGNFPQEKYEAGFLDYEDPVLHQLAELLSEQAWKHNNTLLDIIRYSPDAKERERAGMLLSWAKHPENIAAILAWDILIDPDSGVRNNVARSFIFVLGDMKNRALLKDLLPAYCKQAALPSHSDRNKALISIQKILEADQAQAAHIPAECRNTITYISEMSILDNVGGVAKEIEKIIENSENA